MAPGSLPGDPPAVKGNSATDGASVRRLLGVDYGEATIGLAVSDETGLIAQGLTALRRRGGSRDFEAIAALVRERQVGAIVVGHPRNMDGTIGPAAQAAESFARALGDRTGLPVHLWDERLSTRQAERAMIQAGVRRARRRSAVDVVAAILILQNFLDHRGLAASSGRPGGDAPADG